MNVSDTIASAALRLKRAGIDQARLEAESLLAHALKRDAAWILAHPEARLGPRAAAAFRRLIGARARRVPFAYVVGTKAFYGREFLVRKDVLIPRPETETLIEAALAAAPEGPVSILDVGTGSGAIGLTLAAERPGSDALLTDVSARALAVARKNARALKIHARFAKLDVLKPSKSPRLGAGFLILAANLPYLPEARMRTVSPEVRREPRLALVSGADGLRHCRALARRLAEWRLDPDLLLIEAEPGQMEKLETLFGRVLPDRRFARHRDLYGDERVLSMTKNPA